MLPNTLENVSFIIITDHYWLIGSERILFLKYLFIYFWLHRVLVAARGLSCPAACGILVPRPGIEPASPALAGGFLTTGPPGKSPERILIIYSFWCFPVMK